MPAQAAALKNSDKRTASENKERQQETMQYISLDKQKQRGCKVAAYEHRDDENNVKERKTYHRYEKNAGVFT